MPLVSYNLNIYFNLFIFNMRISIPPIQIIFKRMEIEK